MLGAKKLVNSKRKPVLGTMISEEYGIPSTLIALSQAEYNTRYAVALVLT